VPSRIQNHGGVNFKKVFNFQTLGEQRRRVEPSVRRNERFEGRFYENRGEKFERIDERWRQLGQQVNPFRKRLLAG
jgi:hypothetical protein